jgi:hypothetical protein
LSLPSLTREARASAAANASVTSSGWGVLLPSSSRRTVVLPTLTTGIFLRVGMVWRAQREVKIVEADL